jgi:GMP synthase-like glutamine amidotransferase
MNKIKHFLLVFDHEQGQLIEEKHFQENAEQALEAYAAKEKEHREDRMIEIVLIGSDSIETVKLTHANYYDGSVAVSKYLAGI